MSMIKPFSYSMAAVLLSSTSALAAACFDDSSTSCATSNASDCLALGYSKDDVVGCKHYLLCPFDTSYKACVTQKFMDCSDYPLTKCPDNGFCSECNDGSTTKYKLDSCKEGYKLSGNTCVADNKCDGYNLTKCPDLGICSECNTGSTIMYKLDSCKYEGYVIYNNTCILPCDIYDDYLISSDKDLTSPEMFCNECLDGGSTIRWQCQIYGIWIRRTENPNGSYSYRCLTTVGEGDKIAYILSDMTGNCSTPQSSGRRGGICDGSTISGVYVSSGKEIKLCSVFPVSNGDDFSEDRCYWANDDIAIGFHNANMSYGTTKTVTFKDHMYKECFIYDELNNKNIKSVQVTYDY